MNYKWIGAALIIAGCGGFGFSIAAGCRREERLLRQLIQSLQYMRWELQYRLTPLPELCRETGKGTSGVVRDIFLGLARELDWQASPDVSSCMNAALKRNRELPRNIRRIFLQLGRCLGRFDLQGQLLGLEAVQSACQGELAALNKNRDVRLRSYQTLGLCAGVALAILFA